MKAIRKIVPWGEMKFAKHQPLRGAAKTPAERRVGPVNELTAAKEAFAKGADHRCVKALGNDTFGISVYTNPSSTKRIPLVGNHDYVEVDGRENVIPNIDGLIAAINEGMLDDAIAEQYADRKAKLNAARALKAGKVAA